jgi:type IV pilus assembly protein PilQ
MRRVCTLATLTVVALSIGAGRAGAAHSDTTSARAARDAAAGAVTALSVVPGDGRAEVVISVTGSVTAQDFTIQAPHRIVIDIAGARLSRLERPYDRQPRAGIINIRAAQYRPDVVRVVLDLDGPRPYTVSQGGGSIRVSLASNERFVAWSSQGQIPAVATRPVAEPDRPAPPAVAPPAERPAAPVVAAPPPPVERPAPVVAAPPPPVERPAPPVAAAPPPVAERPAPPVAPVVERAAPPATPPSNVSRGAVAPADSADRAARARAAATIDSLVNAQPSRPPVVEAPPAEVPSTPPPSFAARMAMATQQSQQPRITVTYQNADLREVIAGFAGFSGRTIVVGKSVTGQVDAEIKDQPWDVAFRSILEAQGLAAIEDPSGIIVVDSYANILEKQASEPLARQIVKLNYATAGSLVKTVEQLLSRDCAAPGAAAAGAGAAAGGGVAAPPCLVRGAVAADSGTNSLLITEVSSRLADLLAYVRQLDVRTPQVALKAKIISVNRTEIEQLGLSYDLGSSAAYFNTLLPRNQPGSEQTIDQREGRVTLGGDVVAGMANATRKFRNGSALNVLFSTALGKYSLTSFLDALRENNLSDIQAEPSVVTLDNRQARILVGQETPVRVIDAGSTAQIGAPVRANVQFKETGIILIVTPHITNNRQIRMVIEAEQSNLNIVGGDLGFNIDKRNATTQLLVNDGETAVIGGLTQTSITRNRSGIPILSDLPLLGRLFSQSESRELKQDLLILITPHIIDEGEAVRPPNGSK